MHVVKEGIEFSEPRRMTHLAQRPIRSSAQQPAPVSALTRNLYAERSFLGVRSGTETRINVPRYCFQR